MTVPNKRSQRIQEEHHGNVEQDFDLHGGCRSLA
jgi:hypothetical protein